MEIYFQFEMGQLTVPYFYIVLYINISSNLSLNDYGKYV